LEEAVEANCVQNIAQKTRKEAETKARKKAEKQRIAEEEKKKKQMKYLQQLQNKVLAENAILLESTKGSQIVRTECKENILRNEEKQWPSKAKRKQSGRYYSNFGVKIEVLTTMRGICVCWARLPGI